jgi:hypothetical protein
MKVVGMIVAVLLLVLGGGCTVFAFNALTSFSWMDADPTGRSIAVAIILGWLLGGLVPLAIVFSMFWGELRNRRKKSTEAAHPEKLPEPPKSGEGT